MRMIISLLINMAIVFVIGNVAKKIYLFSESSKNKKPKNLLEKRQKKDIIADNKRHNDEQRKKLDRKFKEEYDRKKKLEEAPTNKSLEEIFRELELRRKKYESSKKKVPSSRNIDNSFGDINDLNTSINKTEYSEYGQNSKNQFDDEQIISAEELKIKIQEDREKYKYFDTKNTEFEEEFNIDQDDFHSYKLKEAIIMAEILDKPLSLR